MSIYEKLEQRFDYLNKYFEKYVSASIIETRRKN